MIKQILTFLGAMIVCLFAQEKIASFDKDTSFIIYGPLFTRLPALDSLKDSTAIPFKKTTSEIPYKSNSNDAMIATGSVYRTLILSPKGSSEFSGGLQMQIQGQLNQNLQVSGVLTDESIPIQPEGTTESINEIDKIYMQILHPNFQFEAGDIDAIFDQGKYTNISKRLVGLKNNFNTGRWSGTSVFAGSKGRYRQKEFKGEEAKQGPYFLDSETGNRNIVVLAGSERVYLNGKHLLRGEDRDYIMSYSAGELHFTPQNIIHSDSDILIEYQYSDFQFAQNVYGSSLSGASTDKGNITITWLNEADQINGSALNLADQEIEILKASGDQDALVSEAFIDSSGDYIYFNEEFIYMPDEQLDQVHYNVTFSNDNEHGAYIRQLTENGKIYYSYIDASSRNDQIDLYSPDRIISKPVNTQCFELSGQYHISPSSQLEFSTAFSDWDKNTLSALDDDDNHGLAYHVKLVNEETRITKQSALFYSMASRKLQKQFNTVQREREPQFYTEWNLDPALVKGESQQDVSVGLKVDDLGYTTLNYSLLKMGRDSYQRMWTQLNGGYGVIPSVNLKFNIVNGKKGKFTQQLLDLVLLNGALHPFYNMNFEEQENEYQFEHQTIGIRFTGQYWNTSAGIGKRIDFLEADSTSSGLEKSSSGLFGSFELNGRSRKGWSNNIILHKRIKDDFLHNSQMDFVIASVRSSFFRNDHPVRWDFKSVLEKTYSERRAVVYDWVGIGMGNYRYDEALNSYVSDPNGDYIAYTIFTGSRTPTTKYDGLQIINIDFSKYNVNILKKFKFFSEVRAIFEVELKNDVHILFPVLNDSSITNSQWNIRNEVIHQGQSELAYKKFWQNYAHDFNGLDSRGHELNVREEYGFLIRNRMPGDLYLESSWQIHQTDVQSTVSISRSRSAAGQWISMQLKFRLDQWQLDGGLHYGHDKGDVKNEPYTAATQGARLEMLRFLGKSGRLQALMEFYQSITDHPLKVIPPEAINGLAYGTTFRSNVQAQWMIGRGFSVNINLNYLSDQRYKNFVTLNGEIRAHF